MFEPPILNQLMGVGSLLIGFAGACRYIKLQEKRKEEERREEQEFASMIIQGYNHAFERGREDKWQEIRKNIRRKIKVFTYNNGECNMQIVWDRQAWDLSTCKRREKLRDLEMMAHMQHEIDDLKKQLQKEQSLRKRLEAENFQLKLRRK